MPKGKPVVLAVKKTGPDGQVIPGKVLGEFRAVEHATHGAVKRIIAAHESIGSVGIFNNGVLQEGLELI